MTNIWRLEAIVTFLKRYIKFYIHICDNIVNHCTLYYQCYIFSIYIFTEVAYMTFFYALYADNIIKYQKNKEKKMDYIILGQIVKFVKKKIFSGDALPYAQREISKDKTNEIFWFDRNRILSSNIFGQTELRGRIRLHIFNHLWIYSNENYYYFAKIC